MDHVGQGLLVPKLQLGNPVPEPPDSRRIGGGYAAKAGVLEPA